MKNALKFRRRKTERPQEIIEAATVVFAEKGFAGTKLAEIAARAGVTKGTLYLYYDTKEALFEAVVKSFATSAVKDLCGFVEGFEGSFADLLPQVPAAVIGRIEKSRIPAVAKLVIGESHNFPDLAKVWRNEVLVPMLGAITKRVRLAQKAGEVIEGPPELLAMSIASPIVLTLLFREVFGAAFAPGSMLAKLADVHGRTLVGGMLLGARPSALSTKKRLSKTR